MWSNVRQAGLKKTHLLRHDTVPLAAVTGRMRQHHIAVAVFAAFRQEGV
jgi:hypothetical protein